MRTICITILLAFFIYPSFAYAKKADRDVQVVKLHKPVYPQEMAESGTEGYVVVEAEIDKDGKVTRARAEESSHKIFERYAIAAVGFSKFLCAIENGKKVKKKVRVRVNFELKEKED